MSEITFEEWEQEGVKLFGENKREWKFVCPVCGHVASIQEYKDAGAHDAIAFSCIGRFIESEGTIYNKKSPCNYAGGGLFKLNPVKIIDRGDFFDFYRPPQKKERP